MPTRNDPGPVRFAILAADTVLFTMHDNRLYVRLMRIDRPPFFKNAKGLPGGLIAPDEIAEHAAIRHLETKGGVAASKLYVEQLYTFSRVDRDPRGRVVAVAYSAYVPWDRLSKTEQADSEEVWWARADRPGKLAYDHGEILAAALERLCSRISYTTLLSKLLPEEFTLTELEQAYSAILDTPLDKRNFRKKVMKLGIVQETGEKRGERYRPAKLYAFASKKVVVMDPL